MTTTTAATSADLLGAKVTSYEANKTSSATLSAANMGKQDFLKLFTAQLNNQDPLDPVKNEAFVAQLAQFSQLEALTNIQTSMDGFVNSMSAEKMLGSASLIGKRISVADAPSQLVDGGSIDANIDLPQGASGVQLSVTDANGNKVQDLVAGAQLPGTANLSWDGKDSLGNAAPAGTYYLTANAVVGGKTTKVSVNTLATVRSITTNPADGSISLDVGSGKPILLSSVKQISQ
jgi:flagellar basal-body rod modification protein FlgD